MFCCCCFCFWKGVYNGKYIIDYGTLTYNTNRCVVFKYLIYLLV